MPKRNFRNWLREYADYTKISEAPDQFHFWTGTSTIAGVLRRKVWSQQRTFQWTPNFYIVLVGPAGTSTKSTSMRIGSRLLRQIDGIFWGPQAITWQALTQSLAGAKLQIPFKGEYLEMSCINCSVSELGTFLKPKEQDLVDVLVSLWDGQLEDWDKVTKGEGTDTIVNPWINMQGCTTPAWLRDNFPTALIEGGLTSRIVFVYGKGKRYLVPYPSDIIDEDKFADQGKRLVEDLNIINEIIGEYELTPEAKAWGVAWYEQLNEYRPERMASERFSSWLGRKQGHLHKVAMVLAAAKRDDLVLTEGDLMQANDVLTDLEADMHVVFQSLGTQETSRATSELLQYVRIYKQIDVLDLWRLLMPIMSPNDFIEATKGATAAGYIRVTGSGNSRVYHVVEQEDE